MDGRTVIVVAALVGYLIGSIPTANGLAKLWGVDLRSGGTGNPGANNARRLGGYALAAAVLSVEMSKGVIAVVAGSFLADDIGAVLAGIGAIAGNVNNVWYRFQGGKGLAISAGVLLAAWPVALPFLLVLLALGAAVTRSSGIGALITLGGVVAGAILWSLLEWPHGWGVRPDTLLFLAPALVVLLTPKHLDDAGRRLREPFRP